MKLRLVKSPYQQTCLFGELDFFMFVQQMACELWVCGRNKVYHCNLSFVFCPHGNPLYHDGFVSSDCTKSIFVLVMSCN